jgi:hypothetical protein
MNRTMLLTLLVLVLASAFFGFALHVGGFSRGA